MKKKFSSFNFFFFVLLSVLFSACEMIYFDRAPGKILNEIPEELRGNYRAIDKIKKINTDSVEKITVFSKSWINNDEETHLSDSVLISIYGAYYFLSMRKNSQFWNCYIINKTSQGFYIYPVVIPDGSVNKKIRILKEFFGDIKTFYDYENKEKYWAKMDEKKAIKYLKRKLKPFEYYKIEPVKN